MRRLCQLAIIVLLYISILLVSLAQDSETNEDDSLSPDSVPATYDVYIVQSGDTLFGLAERFNTTIEALKTANSVLGNGRLLAGQSLLVPSLTSSYVEVYEVQAGDTLFSISQRFNTSVGILQGLNDIADGSSILAGQSLIVPVDRKADLIVHLVEANESLFSIARRYNTAVSVLMSLNGILDEKDLRQGETILVPKVDETRYEVYEITAADSLYSVARRFATTEDALISLNGLAGPRDFRVGQTIIVPRIDETKYQVYVVEAGDNLFNISRQFNTTVAQLRALNGIDGQRDLTVGRSIIVPVIDETLFDTVIVKPGDSLYGISRQYNVSVAALQALNRLANPRDIRVDQAILVPKLDNAVLDVHVVRLGDNLTRIAEAYGTTVPFLKTLNGIADPSLIQLDEIILVPKPVDVMVRSGFGFGIQVFIDQENASALAQQVATLGVDWVKVDVSWAEVETEPGIYNYSALDEIVAAMELVDVQILLNVFDAPAWSRTGYTEKLNSQMRDYGGPPEDLNDFAVFLANLVTRYAGIVDAYEIWKSPNLLKFWTVPVYSREPELNAEGDYGIPDEVQLGAQFYVPLLQVGHETIKSHDQEALVISGGLAPVGFSDGYNSVDTGSFLQAMLEGGAADYSDAIGAVFSASAVPPTLSCCDKPPGVESHYESFLQYFPELMEFYDEVLTENDLAELPIMVTQVGWGTREGANIAIPSSGFEWLNYTSEEEQALYVTQAYQLVQELDSVTAMFLYNLNGCAVDDAEACFFSLVDAAGTQRPVYASFESVPKSAGG